MQWPEYLIKILIFVLVVSKGTGQCLLSYFRHYQSVTYWELNKGELIEAMARNQTIIGALYT